MGPIQVLFGTESGNAEMVADDIVDALEERGIEAHVTAMDEYDVSELPTAGLAILITSTYGEGELPITTAPFHDAVLAAQPDLSDLEFAAFGLGDSSYETYNNAVAILTGTLTERGARQLGEIGRHDASSGQSYTDEAVAWIDSVLQLANAS